MSTNASSTRFWQENEHLAADRPFLNSSQKQYLVDNNIIFHIQDVFLNAEHEYEGRRSPQWELVLTIPQADKQIDKSGKELELDAYDTFTLGMMDNPQRERMFGAMASHMRETGEVIASRLNHIAPRNGGNGFYQLAPPE